MNATERADILDKAADYIDEHGWFQHDFSDWNARTPLETPQCCALGAIGMVYANNPDAATKLETRDDIHEIETALYRITGNDIGEWNDDPKRTKEEVTAALRSCAAELRQS